MPDDNEWRSLPHATGWNYYDYPRRRRGRKPLDKDSFEYRARLQRAREERAIARARKVASETHRAPLYDQDGQHIGWIRMRAAPVERVKRSDGFAAGEGEAAGEAAG